MGVHFRYSHFMVCFFRYMVLWCQCAPTSWGCAGGQLFAANFVEVLHNFRSPPEDTRTRTAGSHEHKTDSAHIVIHTCWLSYVHLKLPEFQEPPSKRSRATKEERWLTAKACGNSQHVMVQMHLKHEELFRWTVWNLVGASQWHGCSPMARNGD